MMSLEDASAFALSLPEATEEPHFDMSSFRVRGKIFATVPPDGTCVHVFVDEQEIAASVSEDPAAFEPLLWGRQCVVCAFTSRTRRPDASGNSSRTPGAARRPNA
jgi:YjbR